MIGDSSTGDHLRATSEAVNHYSSKLRIVHRECPDMTNGQAISVLLGEVDTEYSAFVGDDDFLCVSGLNQCVGFLASNPEYASAHGRGVMFSLATGTTNGDVAGVFHYRQGTIEGETASQRLIQLFGNYFVTVFSVHHTETFRHMFQEVPGLAEWSFATELLPCAMSAVHGKAKELNCLYLIRQHHDQRYALPDTFDWMTNGDWSSSYQSFRTCLVDEIITKDRIPKESAEATVKLAFSSYLNQRQKLEAPTRKTLGSRARVTFRSVPGIRSARNAMRVFVHGRQETISLAEFLKPNSDYHHDFMPIYRSITGKVETPII